MSAAGEVCVVLVTAPSEPVAEALARALLDARLIACANLVPQVRSLYRWQGAICDEREVVMVLKTTTERFDALKAKIVSLHSYEVPEIMRLSVAEGHAPYLEWVRNAVVAASD